MRPLLLAALLFSAAPARAQEAAPASPPPPATQAKPDWMAYQNPYAAVQKDLTAANRTNEEVISWASRAAAEVLTFPAASLQDRVKTLRPYFDQDGWAAYAAHLKATEIFAAAQDPSYAVATAADGDPMLANSGVQSDAWHWEVRVPVMTTISQKAADGGEARAVSTFRTRLTLLIRRVAEGGIDGLAIDGWSPQAMPAP